MDNQINTHNHAAEKAALRLIARAEQNTAGLRRKLEKRGYEPECIDTIIERLCTQNLLDDNRFARLWLESRLCKTSSPRRLFIALCVRGIDRVDAEAALKNVLDNETEYTLLLRFAKKQMRKINSKGEDANRSLKYLLRNEGFSAAAIQRFLERDE